MWLNMIITVWLRMDDCMLWCKGLTHGDLQKPCHVPCKNKTIDVLLFLSLRNINKPLRKLFPLNPKYPSSSWSLDSIRSPYTLDWVCIYTSIAARGGGGSFKREKKYIIRKNMCLLESFVTTLIHWTFFFWWREQSWHCWLCRSGQSMWHQVLDDAEVSASLSQISPQRHATLPTHQTVPSTTPYYKVLKSAAPVLFCATKYYSSTTLYYKVLLQKATPVLQSASPVLLRTTKYYLQYYSVLQSTTPVLLRTTRYYKVLLQYYSVQQSTTPVLLVLQSTTSYYKVLVQYYFVLQSTSPVLRTTKY